MDIDLYYQEKGNKEPFIWKVLKFHVQLFWGFQNSTKQWKAF